MTSPKESLPEVVRKAFEAWLAEQTFTPDRIEREIAWEAWQAAFTQALSSAGGTGGSHDWTKCERVRCQAEEICTRPQACFAPSPAPVPEEKVCSEDEPDHPANVPAAPSAVEEAHAKVFWSHENPDNQRVVAWADALDLARRLDDMTSDYFRRHKDACDHYEARIAAEAALNRARALLRELLPHLRAYGNHGIAERIQKELGERG